MKFVPSHNVFGYIGKQTVVDDQGVPAVPHGYALKGGLMTGLSDPQRIEVLKTLYEGELTSLRALSDRSFTTTLQALTVDGGVLIGMIGTRVVLSFTGKCIGSILLGLFHLFVVSYLVAKARAHHREKKSFVGVQAELLRLSGIVQGPVEPVKPSFCRSFCGGSGLFIAAVIIAGLLSVASLWLPMLK